MPRGGQVPNGERRPSWGDHDPVAAAAVMVGRIATGQIAERIPAEAGAYAP